MIQTKVSPSKMLHKHPMIKSPCHTGYFELERLLLFTALLSCYALHRFLLLL